MIRALFISTDSFLNVLFDILGAKCSADEITWKINLKDRMWISDRLRTESSDYNGQGTELWEVRYQDYETGMYPPERLQNCWYTKCYSCAVQRFMNRRRLAHNAPFYPWGYFQWFIGSLRWHGLSFQRARIDVQKTNWRIMGSAKIVTLFSRRLCAYIPLAGTKIMRN